MAKVGRVGLGVPVAISVLYIIAVVELVVLVFIPLLSIVMDVVEVPGHLIIDAFEALLSKKVGSVLVGHAMVLEVFQEVFVVCVLRQLLLQFELHLFVVLLELFLFRIFLTPVLVGLLVLELWVVRAVTKDQLVVFPSKTLVAQHGVSFCDILEVLLRTLQFFFAFILFVVLGVWMILFGQLVIRFLDLIGISLGTDVEQLVVASLRLL